MKTITRNIRDIQVGDLFVHDPVHWTCGRLCFVVAIYFKKIDYRCLDPEEISSTYTFRHNDFLVLQAHYGVKR